MDFNFLETQLLNDYVPVPLSGTLSGHAAGEPFDKHVYEKLKNKFPNKVYRQFEYLNKLFEKNPKCKSYDNRANLIESETIKFLLMRGRSATENWSKNDKFEEKQNDTADVLVIGESFKEEFNIIDVKTENLSKKAQAPNIISAEKLAKACSLMIEYKDFNKVNIDYVGIGWEQIEENLVCKEAFVRNLFKTPPNSLYINWTAAQQIQLHVKDFSQNFKGTKEEWCKKFIEHCYGSLQDNVAKKLKKFEYLKKYL